MGKIKLVYREEKIKLFNQSHLLDKMKARSFHSVVFLVGLNTNIHVCNFLETWVNPSIFCKCCMKNASVQSFSGPIFSYLN